MSSDRILSCTCRSALALLLFAATFAPSPSFAQAGDSWTVAEVSGGASRQTADAQWVPLKQGDTVTEGASVRTGADGRIVLARASHKDTITASPGSQFAVPTDAASETGPTILQTLGTLLFKVEHTPGRHFEVKGPYLTAVVKGTIFTVTVGRDENVVSLAKGSVEVTDGNTREVALLRPGQTARVPVAPGRPMTVIGALVPGAAPPVRTEAQAGDGEQKITRTLGDVHLDVAALSNNLVRPVGGAAGNSRTPNRGASSDQGAAGNASTEAGGTQGAASGSTANAAGSGADAAAGVTGNAITGVGTGVRGNMLGSTVGSIVSAIATSVGGGASAAGVNTGSIVSAAAHDANSQLKGAKSKGKTP